jgi:hypothetical protein
MSGDMAASGGISWDEPWGARRRLSAISGEEPPGFRRSFGSGWLRHGESIKDAVRLLVLSAASAPGFAEGKDVAYRTQQRS